MNDTFYKCPSCGYSVADDLEPTTADDLNWAYTKTEHKDRAKAIKKSEIRMREELGYGILEKPDLGSCITGEWVKDEN